MDRAEYSIDVKCILEKIITTKPHTFSKVYGAFNKSWIVVHKHKIDRFFFFFFMGTK